KVAGVCDCPTLGTKDSSNRPNGNVFMFTPKIDLTAVQNAWLRFDSYFNKASAGSKSEEATIEISVNGGASWTILLNVAANVNTKIAESIAIDLGANSNKPDVRIGFRYSDNGIHTNIGGWAVDIEEVFATAR